MNFLAAAEGGQKADDDSEALESTSEGLNADTGSDKSETFVLIHINTKALT